MNSDLQNLRKLYPIYESNAKLIRENSPDCNDTFFSGLYQCDIHGSFIQWN